MESTITRRTTARMSVLDQAIGLMRYDPERYAGGFEAQSPTGDGCRVRFDEVRLEARTLGELRDGS